MSTDKMSVFEMSVGQMTQHQKECVAQNLRLSITVPKGAVVAVSKAKFRKP
jgi:hypothetical protein